MAAKRNNCFRFWAILLIITSIITIILSFINLNNLVGDEFLELASFQFSGRVGELPPYCMDQDFLGFAWCCGLLSFTALLTGLMAFGVEDKLNAFNLVFLFVCGFTAFISSIVIVVCSSMVLVCHVTLTGLLPATNLFISIFAVLQLLLSILAFLKVLKKRWEMSSDIKYGIEPLPDPFELTINPQNIAYVQGANPAFDSTNPYPAEKDFFKAMSKKGSHFNASYARGGGPSNPTKFQISNGAKQYAYNNGGPVSNMPAVHQADRRVLNAANGARAASRWVPNAGMGGQMGAGGRAMAYPSGNQVYVGNARKFDACPEGAFNEFARPVGGFQL